jgi:N6-L-threonylcarbamoyladenine synthase
MQGMLVLGIETSCDETAAAVVADGPDGTKRILSNVVLSQLAEHTPYGGVVPEIAARAHLDQVDHIVRQAMQEAGVAFSDLSAIAATCGPGLIGGVLVGAMTGKAIAAATKKPFIAVNHLEAHALMARLTNDVPFPYLLLLASGGHCQLLAVNGVGQYRLLGATIDDAAGEAFDKGAKLLGLGFPGGPALERAAATGNPKATPFPRPLKGRPGCDFSFSGLKTALRQQILTLGHAPTEREAADLAASYQAAIAESLADRTEQAIHIWGQTEDVLPKTLVVSGGVAANKQIRSLLEALAAKHALTFAAPPLALCTDNAAMVAYAGLERLHLGLTTPLNFAPRPRWPLVEGG